MPRVLRPSPMPDLRRLMLTSRSRRGCNSFPRERDAGVSAVTGAEQSVGLHKAPERCNKKLSAWRRLFGGATGARAGPLTYTILNEIKRLAKHCYRGLLCSGAQPHIINNSTSARLQLSGSIRRVAWFAQITLHYVNPNGASARVGSTAEEPPSTQVEAAGHSRPARVPVGAIVVQLQGTLRASKRISQVLCVIVALSLTGLPSRRKRMPRTERRPSGKRRRPRRWTH